MKTKKAIFGLILSMSVLISMNSMKKTTQANLGWGISALFGADNNTTSTNVTAGTLGGGAVAALIIDSAAEGAELGALGGPAGIVVGAVVGGL
jgi:hypothetical protein